MGTSRCRRVQVGFTPAQRVVIVERAQRSGASLSATVRDLVISALESGQATEADEADRALVGLGTLVAAEHSLRLLELSLPQLSRRSPQIREEAYASAQARLEELRRHLETSDG